MDGWATGHIAKLKAGETVQFRPRGNSMTGKVDDGNLCTVEPVTDAGSLNVGDVVLVKVNGKVLFHLIRAIGADKRFQIANNKGFINGWVAPSAIFGRCVKVEK